MRWLLIWIGMLSLIAEPALADGEKAGEFDYYVLSLSWSPNWCAIEGDARGSDQCDTRHDHGWILHGLWPQYEKGWPAFCRTSEPSPTRGMTAGMTDIMGSPGLAWHQWRKHGTCSGLSASEYFGRARKAYDGVIRPAVFRRLDQAIKLPASVVEEAFLKANPDWEADMLTITCRDGHIQEARLCLSRDLAPVPCSPGVVRECRMRDALFTPIR